MYTLESTFTITENVIDFDPNRLLCSHCLKPTQPSATSKFNTSVLEMFTARHGTARHGTARHGTARHGTARHGTARHGTARHGTATLGNELYRKL